LPEDHRFGADGERPVSRPDQVWFRNGGCGTPSLLFCGKAGINRKFTPNQIKRIFRKFSAI
jgi:hypothetical protein